MINGLGNAAFGESDGQVLSICRGQISFCGSRWRGFLLIFKYAKEEKNSQKKDSPHERVFIQMAIPFHSASNKVSRDQVVNFT